MTLLDAARQFPSIFDGSEVVSHDVVASGTTGAIPVAAVPVAAVPAPSVPAAALPVAAEPVAAEPVAAVPTDFAALGLPGPLVRALRQADISTPFPIQAATIPDALAGRDVLARGQTGSGKTLAFGLPVLTRIAASGRSAPRRPKALVLVPTRELAMQVNDVLIPLAKSLGLSTKTAFGGAPYETQISALLRGVDVLVATPGRLGDLIEKGMCSLESIEITVLDEADQMADLGFLPDVTALLAQTPSGAQRLLFSATLDGDVDALVRRFLSDPVTHELQPAVATVDTMDHHALLIPATGKFEVLASIANRRGRTIMFVKTQMAVDRLVGQLADVGVRSAALHGGKTQRVRTRTLAEFREGRFDVLIATNVAARGIHVDGVSLVVHVDPPADAKDYLHRAGRTARAGEKGTVVTLVLPRQRRSTFTMLEKAGVDAARTPVTPEAPELAEVTGARTPSGVPVPPEPVMSPRDRRPRDRGPREYGGREYRQREFRPREHRTQDGRSHESRPHERRPSESRPYEKAHDRRPHEARPAEGRTREQSPREYRPRTEHGGRPTTRQPAWGREADRRQFNRSTSGHRQGAPRS
jgi:superfamily II DNA/RNA helicase